MESLVVYDCGRMFLDDIIRIIWRWWLWQRRIKRFRSWVLTSAVVTSCRVTEDGFGERLNAVFRYEVNSEQFTGSIMSTKRRAGTTMRLEDDVLEGHLLSIRVNPADAYLNGALNVDNPQWPWQIEE
jgi:hypothetical protein